MRHEARNSLLLDIGPRQLVDVAGSTLPSRYTRALERFRYGSGVFKLDYALREPIPWRDPHCARAATVHLGGTLEEIAASERAARAATPAERPFVILAQQSLFDAVEHRMESRRRGRTATCPTDRRSHGRPDRSADRAVRARFSRYRRGARRARAARVRTGESELVGGDINGGANTLLQLVRRPTIARVPYRTPIKGVYSLGIDPARWRRPRDVRYISRRRIALGDLNRG